MKLFKLMGYEIYHPEVERFHRSLAKVKVATAARRSSKSFSAAMDATMDCLLPDRRIWVVGASYGLAEKEFRYFHKKLVLERDKLGIPAPKHCQVNPKSGQLYIEWPWGTILEGKSADRPEGLLGEAVDIAIYAEAGQLPRSIREQYVEPCLMTKQGREIIPTTPDEGAEWVFELVERAGTGEYDWLESFHWDGAANPLYDWNHYEKMTDFYGEDNPVFREQYCGEWVFHAGRVFPMFKQESHVIEPFDIPEHWPRIRAIDFGHNDPFCCLWTAVGPSGELYVYREYYDRQGLPTRVHSQLLKELTKDERISQTVADPSAKQLIEDLAYEGIHCSPANNDRQSGRNQVANYMLPSPEGTPPYRTNRVEGMRYPRLYVFSSCFELARELRFYRWAPKGELNKEGVKEKTVGDDHAVDCLRYTCQTRPAPFISTLRPVPGSFMETMKRIKAGKHIGKFYGK